MFYLRLIENTHDSCQNTISILISKLHALITKTIKAKTIYKTKKSKVHHLFITF